MKTGKSLIFLVSFLVLVLLAACASSASTPSTTGSPTQVPSLNAPSGATVPTTTALANGAAPTPTIDGDALIRSKLQNHHDIERIYSAHKTRAEWSATIDRMISYGAQINAQEKEEIIDYLMSRQQ